MLRICVACLLLICDHKIFAETEVADDAELLNSKNWLINDPKAFYGGNRTGAMLDERKNKDSMGKFVRIRDEALSRTDGFTDGEVVDALDHYFWGMRNGIAMELGALDGSRHKHSMTFDFEHYFGWKRILIEGNPFFRSDLRRHSPLALTVNAAICSTPSIVHYTQSHYVGGIVEFMAIDFLEKWHPKIYNLCAPSCNVSTLDYSLLTHLVKTVECIPLSDVLQHAEIKHINYFVLDVEVSNFFFARKCFLIFFLTFF